MTPKNKKYKLFIYVSLDDLARQDQWEELYRRTMLWEFPDDALLGFQLASTALSPSRGWPGS